MEEQKNTMYWQIDYRKDSGWKRKYLFGQIEDINNYTNKRIKYDKIEIKNLMAEEVEALQKMFKTEFKVL